MYTVVNTAVVPVGTVVVVENVVVVVVNVDDEDVVTTQSEFEIVTSDSREAEASRAMIAFRSRPLYRGCMGARTCESAPLGVRGARTCVFASPGMRDLIVYCGFNRRRNEYTKL